MSTPVDARADDGGRASAALVAVVVGASTILWIATQSLALALAPLALTLLVWALASLPPHRVALALFFFAIVVDNPKERPAEGNWASPIEPLGVFLYENLNNITGIQPLRFSATDLLLALLFLAAVTRPPKRASIAVPRALVRILAVAWLAVVWLELWGLVRGGDFKISLWQVRPLFWAPAIAYIFAKGLRGPRDHAAVGKAILVAAVIKAGLGAYYYFVVARAVGHWPQYSTTHSDTILFVAAAVIAIAFAIEKRTLSAVLFALAILAPVFVGVLVNGRRLAYVALAGSLLAIYLMLPPGLIRRTGNRLVVFGTPPLLVYTAIGWTSDAAIFGPARKISTLFSKSDRSAVMRDIENYNLVFSWKQHVLLGTGFGHEYDEVTQPEGAAIIYPLYRYIAHNSVLWLENSGGYLGFTAFWTMAAALAYFAARAYRRAVRPVDRTAALTALTIPVIFGVQAYGDMGLNSWTAMYFLAVGLAVAAKLAVATGAFPPATAGAPARGSS